MNNLLPNEGTKTIYSQARPIFLQINSAREKYKPERIKLLFIAEAPPEQTERFFYYEKVKDNDWLFLGIVKVLCGNGADKKLVIGDLKLDCEGRRVFIAGKEINLTAKEFDVLELLAKNPNKVYSRENLLNLVWGYEYPGDVRTVDVHIRRLREKIETIPSDPKYVHTKWGIGYYFQG